MRFLDPRNVRSLERSVALTCRRAGELTDPSALHPAWIGLFLAALLVRAGSLGREGGLPASLEDLLAPGPGGAAARRLSVRKGLLLFPGVLRPAEECLAALTPETEEALAAGLRDLPEEAFLCDDGLGWAHQAWQAGRKAAQQRSGVRIGAEGLGPVTQLFTDGYMAEFLLSRAFGDLDADHPPRVLDPCCGCGTFLLSALPRLVARWLPLTGGDVRRACDAALEDGLFGLDIDPRCAELTVCSLVLAAWRFPGAGGLRPVPRPRIGCPGHPPEASRAEWISLARGESDLERACSDLWERFCGAAVLGSLLEPPDREAEAVWKALEAALAREDAHRIGTEFPSAGPPYGAGGLLESARLLSDRYGMVATNVPYLSRPKQDPILASFSAARYPEARRDLATVFLERSLALCAPGGVTALVTPQNWLFLGAYRQLRRRLLRETTWRLVVRLGEGAFGSISATGAFSALILLRKGKPPTGHLVEMLDAGAVRGASSKRDFLERAQAVPRDQESILEAEDARLVWTDPSPFPPLSGFAESLVGLQNGDAPRYVRCFWELPAPGGGWVPFQGAPDGKSAVSGRSFFLLWEEGAGSLAASPQARIQGTAAWGRRGVAVRLMRHLDCALYDGAPYDQACAVLLPRDPADLPALWTFCRQGVLAEEVRRIDGKLNVTNAVLLKAPFDLPRWREEALRAFPQGLREPRCGDPTQWDFHGGIAGSAEPLQVAVARLLGYRWPAEGPPSPGDPQACILPLAAGDGRPVAAQRLRALLRDAYGASWSHAMEGELVRRAGGRDGSLETWLRDRFFVHHLSVFRHRPFVWQVWDGRRDGFSALLLCHVLDADRLRALVEGPLAEWIRDRGEGAGDGRAADAAKELRRKLLLILAGEAPYDVFVRWKPLTRQPVGWEPDWGDGVRLNIRPFVEAGILRARPRIRWEADRGRDGPGEPWYGVCGGERRNDLHLDLAGKEEARRAGRP